MKKLTLILIALLALLGASIASAKISIYVNEVEGKPAFESIKRFSGKGCEKEWRKKQSLGFVIDGGRRACEFALPVAGDSKQPDHTIQAVAKLTNGTDKKAKQTSYIGARIRAGRKDGYELRVFPKTRTWSFIRNGTEVEEGRDRAIDAVGKKNLLRLASEGNTVVARVNNEVLTVFKDPQPNEVDGRRALLTSGIATRTKKDAVGLFDDIKLIIPSP